MSRRQHPIQAALAIAGALLIAACGASASTHSTTATTAPAQSTRDSLSLRCHRAPATGPRLTRARPGTVGLPGSPDGIAVTPDARTAFVAIQSGAPRIAVIQTSSTGGRLLRTISVPSVASGLRVTPNGRYLLAAAGRGAIVIDVASALSGGSPVLGTLTAPAAVAGTGPGAAEVAVSADSRYAFVTLEGAGRVAVFHLDGAGTGTFVGAIPVGAGALGITVSPDGRRLYVVGESAPVAGSRDRGALTVIDAARAISDPARAVVAQVAAPCAPVRVAVSASGDAVWVTARDGDALLGYSGAALTTTPRQALISVTRVGPEPLGLAVAGSTVLVADSDLFNTPGARSTVAVVRAVSGAASPTLLGLVPGLRHADAIATGPSADPRLALVTDSGAPRLRALALGRLVTGP